MISSKKIKKIVNESINLIVENSASKRKYINRIYRDKNVDKYLHHSFKDNDWHYLYEMFDAIGQVPGVVDLDVRVEDGGYRRNDMAQWKEYQVSIEVESGDVINGTVRCNFCGTVEDPMDRYDITFTMW